ncbi:MAG: lamin tail domain-containing protein, partial [Cyclobacteriaceae bacterium]
MVERFAFFILLLLTALNAQSQDIFINEFLASNSSTNTDPDFGEHSDWIEIYNDLDTEIDLSNWFLTDNLIDSTKWQIPEGVTLEPKGFLTIWADEYDTSLYHLHTNFRLSKGGEVIVLFNSDTILVDSIVYAGQISDISFGRYPDGGSNWEFFDNPTFGRSNDTPPYLKVSKPHFSLSPGFYIEDQILGISNADSLAVIRYTINGDEPTESSPIYTSPIPIQSRVGEANGISMIRTNLDPYLWLPNWVPPEGEVFKANVIRAKAFRDGYQPSQIVTSTYFVDAEIHSRYATLPVISLSSDNQNLFDDNSGIYVPGIHHRPGESHSGNYFQDWEKPAHIEYFEPGGNLGFAQDVGIRIQGGTSPASPQKGLHVIARNEYGMNRISYPIFQNDPSKARKLTEYKRFIIRAWG